MTHTLIPEGSGPLVILFGLIHYSLLMILITDHTVLKDALSDKLYSRLTLLYLHHGVVDQFPFGGVDQSP